MDREACIDQSPIDSSNESAHWILKRRLETKTRPKDHHQMNGPLVMWCSSVALIFSLGRVFYVVALFHQSWEKEDNEKKRASFCSFVIAELIRDLSLDLIS
jgi:hypothetical protein